MILETRVSPEIGVNDWSPIIFYWGKLKLCPCDSRQLYIGTILVIDQSVHLSRSSKGPEVWRDQCSIRGCNHPNLVLATYFLCEFEQITYSLCPPFLHTINRKYRVFVRIKWHNIYESTSEAIYRVYCFGLVVLITCG